MSTSPDIVRVALIGYGFAGSTFHAPLIGAVPGLSLDLVASRDAARVRGDLPQTQVVGDPMVAATHPDVDLVVIASPNDSHVPLAGAALAAGKHVVVDKPFTLSLRDARDLAALAARSRRMLSVFQNRRWDSDFLAVRQAIDDGLIGEPLHLESRIERFRPTVMPRWREQGGPGSGVWWDLGPHLVDQALALFGLPDQVQAGFAAQRPRALADDWAHVVLGFGKRRAVLHAGMVAAAPAARFVVHGSAGSVVKRGADPQEAQLKAGARPGDPGWGVDEDALEVFVGEQPVRRIAAPPGDQSRYYAAVRDAVRGNGPNPVPPAQAVAVMAVMEASIASAAGGRALPLDLTAAERDAFAGD